MIAIKDPVEVRSAGVRALIATLGHDGAQEFLKQSHGTGDYTKERAENPLTNEQIVAGIKRIQAANAAAVEAERRGS